MIPIDDNASDKEISVPRVGGGDPDNREEYQNIDLCSSRRRG